MMLDFVKKSVLVSSLGSGLCLLGALPASAQHLSIDALYSNPSITGTTPEGYAWNQDGTALAFLWNDAGEPFRDIWLYDVKSGTKTRLTALSDQAASGSAGVSEVAFLADGSLALVLDGALYRRSSGGELQKVAGAPAGAAQLALSSDGRHLAFVSSEGLWLADGVGKAAHLAVPTEAKISVQSYEWAASASKLAYLLSDMRQTRQVEIAYDADGEPHRDVVSRAFPGDAYNIGYHVGTLDAVSGKAALVERDDEQDQVWSIGLSPDGSRLLLDSSDLTIKDRAIDVYDLASGKRTAFYRNHDDTQIRPDWQTVWAADGKGLITLLDDDGYNHLYRIAGPMQEPLAITEGEWEVASFRFDRDDRAIYFESSRDGMENRNWYRVAASGNGAVTPILPRPGTHEPVFGPDFDHYADRFSDDQTPPELYVGKTDGQGAMAAVTHSPLPAFDAVQWAQVDYVDYTSHVDGAPLRARVMLPPDFDPERRYPVIVGSVYSDGLRNQWGGRVAHPTWGLDQNLVSRGYIIVQPEIRGSFGRGSEWNAPMLHSYGELDINDIQDAAQHMVDIGIADPDRIGIWGSSYGGLMTLMSLFKKPGFYAAGVAGAPATNVFHAYPEQEWIMGAAEGDDFPERFQDQSAYYQSAGLADPLTIIQGTKDQVVLYADTMALAQKMIQQGKDFNIVSLPGVGHAWDAHDLPTTRFAFHKLADFFDSVLQPEKQ
ncbi:S9 family peptidase [Altericroceibacterium endophyticum]|nr:prolyl oligopeptidase family serine peptidase [Altericroceibacterium endophyticum]